MTSTLLLLAKIGLLLLLWLFIWLTVRALRKDAVTASGYSGNQGNAPLVGGSAAVAAPSAPKDEHSRKNPRGLVLTSGPLAGTTLKLQGYTDVSIGRAPSNTLVLEDDFASGTHARLTRHGSAWYLEDMDSRNGTWMGGARIDQPERLYAASEFRVGQTTVRMEQS